MEKMNSAPSGDHDEIAVAKESVSRPYSDSEPHEKADDEVSVFYNPIRYTCNTVDIAANHDYLERHQADQHANF